MKQLPENGNKKKKRQLFDEPLFISISCSKNYVMANEL